MDAFFDDLIGIQQAAISSFQKWRKGFLMSGSICFLLSAITWSLAAGHRLEPTLVPPVVTILTMILGAASFYPYKEIAPRQIAIRKLQLLKDESVKIQNLPKDQQHERLNALKEWLKDLPGSD